MRGTVVILDREADLGGTWHVNHYPGLAVDIPSTTYSYWFEPNPYWSRLFALGAETEAVCRTRRRQVRRAPLHAVQHESRRRALGRGRAAVASGAGRRRNADDTLSDHCDRLPVPAAHPRHPGNRGLSTARSSTPRRGTTTTISTGVASESSGPGRPRCS